MPTSGSTNFLMNGQQIMDHAMTLAGLKGIGQTVDAGVINTTRTAFNILIRSLETSGVRLWAIDKAILFPSWNEAIHELPLMNGTVPQAYACFEDDYRQATLAVAVTTGDSSITLDAEPGNVAGDYIGIWTSANGILWYTANTVVGDVVSLYEVGTTTPASIPQDIAIGAIVGGFTKLVWQPLRIIEARRRILDQNPLNNIDVPLRIIGKFDYERIPNKGMASIPIQLYFQPFISQTSVWLWPVLGQTNMVVPFSFERRYQDVDEGIDDVDFPPEAYEALSTLLASRVGRLFRINGDRQTYLDQISAQYFDNLKNYSSGASTFTFGASR